MADCIPFWILTLDKGELSRNFEFEFSHIARTTLKSSTMVGEHYEFVFKKINKFAVIKIQMFSIRLDMICEVVNSFMIGLDIVL